MEINIGENKNVKLENEITNEKTQQNFLESILGKTINTAIDIGIRAILPDFIDEQIINIKDNLLNYGLKDGLQKTIEDAIDLGKSAMGIVTGNFENINQMQNAIKTGGIMDGMSSLLDTVINKVEKEGLINRSVSKTIMQGKNIILNNIESNIENTFSNQIKSIQYTNKYISNWNNYFENKDFTGMEREYKKLQKEVKNLIPLEKTIMEAKRIENLHSRIKNNGQDFNLTEEEIELAKKM